MQAKNQTTTPAPPSQMTIGDIYYVLFKHKWKIFVCSLLGFAVAIAAHFLMPAPYVSEAKLMVRWVQDSKSPAASANSQIQQTDHGENIMGSEAEILSSRDVALAVVDAIGADKIVGKGSASTNRQEAAVILSKNLIVDAPKKGNVLSVVFRHSDPLIVQQVLRQVIDNYFKKHIEIHRNLGVLDEFLTDQTDKIRAKLKETEDSLRKLKSTAHVVSLDDTKKAYSEQYSKLRQEIFAAEVEFEERQTALKEMQKTVLAGSVPADASSTNAAPDGVPKIAPAVVEEYKRLCTLLDTFWKKEQDLLTNFTPENSQVQNVRLAITDLETKKKAMEAKTPGLLQEQTSLTRPGDAAVGGSANLALENARVAALQARIKILKSQFDKIQNEAASVEQVESALVELQRNKEIQESQYRYYSTNLDQARLESTLTAGKLSNISEIQSPSAPLKDNKKQQKIVLGMAVGGVVGGLVFAFLLELIFDQSIRRSNEIESRYHLPLFLSIPEFSIGEPRRRLAARSSLPQLPAGGEAAANGVAVSGNGHANKPEIAPWEVNHTLHPYSEALRDRLVSFFELKGLTHKPKLVALTSCSPGAGVTTLAAGLAASLSEIGEGNVLLVDMTQADGAAHPFFRGKPSCGLADVLDHDKRTDALVHDNLYMVNGGLDDDRLPKMLPKRMAHLVPKLHASDYDYIIFDMPPITQTSITPRIAGFMDMVFMVVEAEKTNRDWLKHATDLLHQSKANLGAVFNKRRAYVPAALHQDF
jgi:succinoglycan biosynthesis transport protein ExoP